MKKFPELKYLDMKSIKHQIFCELKCNTLTDSSYFYGLAQLCQYIQRLIIANVKKNYHGITELIRVQKNLKYFEWRNYDALYITGPNQDSYNEILFALERNANVINHLILHFTYSVNYTLPKILPKLHKLKTLATSFYSFSEEQLKMCVYYDLEVLKI
ncbi:hypothetical protein GLOIN_2v1778669 [Rhizophagus irregularis DAOM 181602=DAOM 197198]|uniref:Uncharacterized protein n=1 Tax=Rhizophagus irregularis (strain DAOM 197198w) TaxID=1432141 RepID=A0A015LG20_RHIIW|nr:hypothetical protein RirG_013650 [Rhizophagus irregularis DAOM 197198w]GBC27630.1 hypothetical protein GLOIN_2v1778669 [Rhizophagus irregularis DAOM 181602=DAOM 197198]